MKSSILRTLRGTLVAMTSPDGLFRLSKMACIVSVFCAATATISPAQTYNPLLSFNGTNGAHPHYVYLVQGTDGQLYGTAYSGTGNGGTVFKITTGGAFTPLYNFCIHGLPCTDGAQPNAGLVLATDGNFYGTTMNGGAYPAACAIGCGTVYQITPGGSLTTLHTFDSTDGAEPEVGLIQASNGALYGTTSYGGTSGVGTTFEIETGGAFRPLGSFDGANGDYPNARLVEGPGPIADLFGVTYEINSGTGSVYEADYFGNIVTVYTFQPAHGAGPTGALIQATNGNFYGTTQGGGKGDNSQGTVFEITPAGKLTTLYSFCAKPDCTDGATPIGGLIQGTDGDLYGTTFSGGTNETSCNGGCGTIFKITTAGKLDTLYNFCTQSGCTDGSQPQEGLVQHTNGNFYGMTYYGGTNGLGTIFSLSSGLGPFVQTLPTSAKVGSTIIVMGNDLTGATQVLFNGIAAAFTIISSTEITATVPTGATTGTVTVVTPNGTLKSNLIFYVIVAPQIKSFTPTSGPVGTAVTITGVGLSQTEEVAFGGVSATDYTVDSDKKVIATVPAGAETGQITITTPAGTATSTKSFTVKE